MKELTLCSLFDGSGGFPLAASMCGITPIYASEVEPYPIAVTHSRFPDMIHLGDVSKVRGHTLTPVDVVSFGSPCQDLSVAGKRAGLKHEDHGDDETTRSGLFMEAVRIIKEMRQATNGMYPTFAVWENVPGALSSSGGDDFLAVLENLAKIADPEVSIPKPDKWCANGEIVGNGFSIAWRIIDARHFGVTVRDGDTGDVLVRGTPQRRRRIYLVADFRGARAGKILFECAGVQGNSEPCAETRQGTSADVKGSVGDAECLTPWDYQSKRVFSDTGAFATLPSGETSGQNQQAVCYCVDHAITTGGNCTAQGPCVYEGFEATLKSSGVHAVCYGISAYESNAMKSSNPHSGIYEADTSRTLDLNGGNPACNQGGIVVVEPMLFENHSQDTRFKGSLDVSPMLPAQLGTGGNNTPFVVEQTYCLQGSMIGRADKNGPQGDGVNEEVCFTCNTTDRHAVAYVESYQKVTGPLMANSHPGSYCGQDAYSDMLITPVPYRQGGFADYVENEVGTVRAAGGDYGGGTEKLVRKNYLVRRLTPTECARLQGFPSIVEVNMKDITRDELCAIAISAGFIHVDIETGKVYATRGPGGTKRIVPIELKGSTVNGYTVYSIHAAGVKKQIRAHRLVWIAAKGLIPDGMVVDHINNDKTDNRIANLQLLTPEANSTKAKEDGCYLVGDDHPTARITEREKQALYFLYWNTQKPYSHFAKMYGMSDSRAQQIIHEKQWGHPDVKTELTDEEYTFWQTVRDTHAEINGKQQKTYTREQMLKWYNNLHTDSAEYKMWGNGIALPCAVFVMQGIAEELKKQKQDLKG